MSYSLWTESWQPVAEDDNITCTRQNTLDWIERSAASRILPNYYHGSFLLQPQIQTWV